LLQLLDGRVGQHDDLAADQRPGVAPAEHLPAQLVPFRAEQVVGEHELHLVGQHVGRGVGRGAADLELQLDAALLPETYSMIGFQ
jgi:hypothetical protein